MTDYVTIDADIARRLAEASLEKIDGLDSARGRAEMNRVTDTLDKVRKAYSRGDDTVALDSLTAITLMGEGGRVDGYGGERMSMRKALDEARAT